MATGTIYTLEWPMQAPAFRLSRILHIQGPRAQGLRPRCSGEFEFHFVAAGSVTFLLDRGERPVSAGEWAVFLPEQTYGIQPSGKPLSVYHGHFQMPRLPFETVSHDLSAWAHVRAKLDPMAPAFARVLCLPDRHAARDVARVERDFVELLNLQRATNVPGHAVASEAFFLCMLQRLSAELLEVLERQGARTLSQAQVHVGRALDFIRKHLDRPISLRDLAEHVRVNEAYLARIFKAHTGETIGAAITRNKIELAKERLLAGRASIKEVAAGLGFQDALYFSRQFRKREGLSPRAYVQRHV